MRIAVQEHLLPGRSIRERFDAAAAIGFAGVEVLADDLTDRVPALADTVMQTQVAVAAVHMGARAGYLSPVLAEREQAISALRQAMTDAVDLDAAHVVFVPGFGPSRMPDLTPYRAPVELEAEMYIWLLRMVSDLAYAIGVELDMLPVNHYESAFLNTMQQAIHFRQQIRNHPHVKIAANTYHMLLEEAEPAAALRACGDHLGYVQAADSNGGLPGAGVLDFAQFVASLNSAGYDGWLTIAGRTTGDLQAALCHLQGVGLAPEV